MPLGILVVDDFESLRPFVSTCLHRRADVAPQSRVLFVIHEQAQT